jgi:hypothetical protein
MANQNKKKTEIDQDDKERQTFIVRTVVTRKMKIISGIEDKFLSDIVDEALSKYIADYEKKNGEIKLK